MKLKKWIFISASKKTVKLFNFSVLGRHEIIDLIEGGRNIQVKEENKMQFVMLASYYKLNKSNRAAVQAFLQGLFEVVPKELIEMFSVKELSLIVNGADCEIDVQEWQNNTIYDAPFHAEHEVILMFWQVVKEEMGEEERSKLLSFVTSSARAPVLGFSSLKFTIHPCVEGEESLPTASTCANVLKLPMYKEKSVMASKLRLAIQERSFQLS